MSTSDSLFHKYQHLVSFYDDEKNNQLSLESLRKLAPYFMSQGYGVVYGVEEFANYDEEPVLSIAKKIVGAKEIPNSESNNNNNSNNSNLSSVDKVNSHPLSNIPPTDKLMIIDPNSMYADNNKSSDIVDYWSLQYSKAAHNFGLDNHKVKGIMGINRPDPYFERKQFDKFLEFEEGIERIFNGKVALICWYKRKWLEELTLPQLLKMISSHSNVIKNDLSIIEWDTSKILNLFTKTIDSEPDTENSYKKENDYYEGNNNIYSNLLFETIRNMYHLDQKSLVTQPEKFEKILMKMLGNNTYEELSKNIKDNFIKEIFGLSGYSGYSQK